MCVCVPLCGGVQGEFCDSVHVSGLRAIVVGVVVRDWNHNKFSPSKEGLELHMYPCLLSEWKEEDRTCIALSPHACRRRMCARRGWWCCPPRSCRPHACLFAPQELDVRKARLVLLPPQMSALRQLTSLNVSDCHIRSLPSEVRMGDGRGDSFRPPPCSLWGGCHSDDTQC